MLFSVHDPRGAQVVLERLLRLGNAFGQLQDEIALMDPLGNLDVVLEQVHGASGSSASGQRRGNSQRSERSGTLNDTGPTRLSAFSSPKSSRLLSTRRAVRAGRPVMAMKAPRSMGPVSAT